MSWRRAAGVSTKDEIGPAVCLRVNSASVNATRTIQGAR
jgi:hypothetical protein